MNQSVNNKSSEPTSDADEAVPLHVHDLPQLHQKPAASALLHALELLRLDVTTFPDTGNTDTSQSKVAEQGVPSYLTSFVSSSLDWIEDEAVRESIWSAASTRLSERSGRNAMPAITRSFVINDGKEHELTVQLHEPTLTEDNLGLKTWTSSLLLSRRLADVRQLVPVHFNQVLELGAGTGLVGVSAACIWQTHVLLTDLPGIVPNLQKNLELNREVIRAHNGSIEARALDWADQTDTPSNEEDKFMVILAADPIYSADHPKMLINTVRRWIHWTTQARFIVELPLRDRYDEERQRLREVLQEMEFELIGEGTDVGYDDWHERNGNPAKVTCWWSVWRPMVQYSSQ